MPIQFPHAAIACALFSLSSFVFAQETGKQHGTRAAEKEMADLCRFSSWIMADAVSSSPDGGQGLPYECRSSEELFRAADKGDVRAAFQLVLFWSRKGVENADLYAMNPPSPGLRQVWGDVFAGTSADAPWFHEPSRWYDYWLARAAYGRGMLALALRWSLEGKTAGNDMFQAVLLMHGARDGDPLFIDFLLSEYEHGALGEDLRARMGETLAQGMAALRMRAVKGEPGMSAAYCRVLQRWLSMGDTRAVGAWMEQGLALFHQDALELLRRSAGKGDALAMKVYPQFSLLWAGVGKDVGGEVDGSFEEDMVQAAERGEVIALLRVSMALLGRIDSDKEASGDVVDRVEKLLLRAAEQNSCAAMMSLCHLYEGKYGGAPQPEKACGMAQRMAVLNYAPGLLRLARYKEEGYGSCAKNPEKAYELVFRAAASLYPEALVEWGRYLLVGIGCEADGKMARKVLSRLYDQSPTMPRVAFFLGYLYEEGLAGETDAGKAVHYYQEGVKLGDDKAMNNLASMYERGKGVDKSWEKALALYRQAAGLGNADARSNVGRLEKH